MKRVPALLLSLLLLLSCALGEAPWFAVPTVVTAQPGGTVTVRCRRLRSAPAGELILTDEEGRELARAAVPRRGNVGLRVAVDASLPNGTMAQLWFAHDGETERQGEVMIAVDDDLPAVTRGDPNVKRIAITFDTAIGVGRLIDLLDLLDRFGVKCTFFMQGEFLRRQPEMAVLISERGHELANHSTNHPDMRRADDEKILREIRTCNELILEVTGQTVRWYRPPSGYYTWRDRSIGRALGCEMVLWTFDSMDGFSSASRATVTNAMRRGTVPGAIILMHIYGRYTLQTLEWYIPEMQAEGYEFVTVGEMLGDGA